MSQLQKSSRLQDQTVVTVAIKTPAKAETLASDNKPNQYSTPVLVDIISKYIFKVVQDHNIYIYILKKCVKTFLPFLAHLVCTASFYNQKSEGWPFGSSPLSAACRIQIHLEPSKASKKPELSFSRTYSL